MLPETSSLISYPKGIASSNLHNFHTILSTIPGKNRSSINMDDVRKGTEPGYDRTTQSFPGRRGTSGIPDGLHCRQG
jgi:hypothetical protein